MGAGTVTLKDGAEMLSPMILILLLEMLVVYLLLLLHFLELLTMIMKVENLIGWEMPVKLIPSLMKK